MTVDFVGRPIRKSGLRHGPIQFGARQWVGLDASLVMHHGEPHFSQERVTLPAHTQGVLQFPNNGVKPLRLIAKQGSLRISIAEPFPDVVCGYIAS